MKSGLKFTVVIVAALLLITGCSGATEEASSTAVEEATTSTPIEVTDIARETACWGYFNSLQPANINEGTQEDRREITRVILEGAIYSSDALLVTGVEKMLSAIESEDADAYRDGSITFITACQKAGLWE
jgi:hypothetical protein